MAKTHKNLYPQVSDYGNLYRAWLKARKNKRYKASTATFGQNLDAELRSLHLYTLLEALPTNPEVVVFALGELGDARAVPTLRDVALNHNASHTRHIAAFSLQRIGGDMATAALAEYDRGGEGVGVGSVREAGSVASGWGPLGCGAKFVMVRAAATIQAGENRPNREDKGMAQTKQRGNRPCTSSYCRPANS